MLDNLQDRDSREIHRERKALRANFYVGAEESVWQFINSDPLRAVSSRKWLAALPRCA